MPKRTNPFQHLIYQIERALAPAATRVIPSAEILDPATGKLREVDVLIEGELAGHTVRIGVECRDHERPQDVLWIEQLMGKYEGLAIDVVVAVSRSGFTSQALAKAQAKGIRALSFEEALAENWPQEFRRLFSQLIAVGPVRVQRTEFKFRNEVPSLDVSSCRVIGSDGRDQGPARDFCWRLYKQHVERQVAQFIDQRKDEFFNNHTTRTEVICVEFGLPTSFLEAADRTRYPLESITLHIACPFEFKPMADRHFRYREGLVTLATAEHAGNAASLTFVQVPEAEGDDIKFAEFRVAPGSGGRQPPSPSV